MLYFRKNLSKLEKEEYREWCRKHGIDPKTHKSSTKKKDFIPLQQPQRYRRDQNQNYKSLDTGVTGAVTTRSMMNPLMWRNESEETINGIVEKSKRIAPHYSKGAAQYITDELDYSDLGRKK